MQYTVNLNHRKSDTQSALIYSQDMRNSPIKEEIKGEETASYKSIDYTSSQNGNIEISNQS